MEQELEVIQLEVCRRTVYVKSKSNPDVKYRVERSRYGNVFCTCPGFLYRRTCRHTKKAKTWK
jgi:hypothetical protein